MLNSSVCCDKRKLKERFLCSLAGTRVMQPSPPPRFYENNSRTDRAIVTKLGIPNLGTILHRP